MKKKYYFVIVYILFLVVLSISIYKTLGSKTLGEIYESSYEPLLYSSDIVKTNMSEITTSNWTKLKETNIKDDKQLKKTYNMLVADIKTCYLLSNDLENKTYDNIKILSFKNKTYITEKELSELNKNKNCLENFDKYNSLVLSDDHELSEKIKKQISIITDYEPEKSTNKSFDDLLYDEVTTMSEVAGLTKWLRIEYYSHKE